MKLKFIFCSALLLCCSLSLTAQVTLNTTPSRILGHPTNESFTVTNFFANLVEGRELNGPGGVAIDTSTSPPVLYVSDTGNNRVLAWKNSATFASGAFADLVIGQPDKFTTNPGGPGTTYSAGLNTPTGIAVRNGDLYVVDSGNNRVLRFPKPFLNTVQQVPNMVLGQPNLGSRVANYPDGKPSATGVTFYPGFGSPFSANLAFDGTGDLWLVDPGNRRVLRFHAADIAANPSNNPAAYQVLGQSTPTDFTGALPNLPATLDCTNNKTCGYTNTQFYVPAGIYYDTSRQLVYVTDADPNFAINRVLVFNIASPTTATKIIGLEPQGTANPSDDLLNRTRLRDPSGVFLLPSGQVGVLDSASSRILLYPPYEQWPDALVSPAATQVIAQTDFTGHNPNGAPTGATYVPAPSASTLYFPTASLLFNNELYVSDSGNNRLIVLPAQDVGLGAGTRVLGQTRFDTNSVNLIEGKEFQFSPEVGLAIDSTGSVPHLYVADTGNHRILGFRDARTVTAGAKADIVIGQPDFFSARCNYPTGDPGQPAQNTVCSPIGLLVDSAGNLWVADSLNARVLRFPAPFAYQGTMEPADLVLGQRDFTSKFTDPSQFNMARPYGLTFSPAGSTSPVGLAVSDVFDNRVLFFRASNGTYTNGQAAEKVIGQPNFTRIATGTDGASFNAPRHISGDTSGRLYVADTGNNRVQIFPDLATAPSGQSAILTISDLTSPRSVFVSPITGEIWVTDTNRALAKRYVSFENLPFNGSPNATIQAPTNTLGLTVDSFGDLYLADFSHRIGIYFPGLQPLNGANFLPDNGSIAARPLAPGIVGSLCAPGSNCIQDVPLVKDLPTTSAPDPTHLPKVLGDIQVLFNGQPSPVYYISARQINFVVPMGKNAGDIPTSGTAEIQVVRVSTNQILAVGSARMNFASPGLYQLNYTGTTRQAAVLNQDGTTNSPSNPAPRGSVIQIFATGQGFVPGAPDDGIGATSPTSVPTRTDVVIGACNVDDNGCNAGEGGGHVKYSGLNGYPGGWQINVQIPQNVAPGGTVPLFVGLNGLYSTSSTDTPFRMTIAVK
jgi:uncharacterized protein (TIGR03437 family)